MIKCHVLKMYGEVEITVKCGGEWTTSHPNRFTPGEIACSIQWTGGLKCPQSWSKCCRKEKYVCPCWESNYRFEIVFLIQFLK
jgi:hypothetical protein